jgi:hypothetical protein
MLTRVMSMLLVSIDLTDGTVEPYCVLHYDTPLQVALDEARRHYATYYAPGNGPYDRWPLPEVANFRWSIIDSFEVE